MIEIDVAHMRGDEFFVLVSFADGMLSCKIKGQETRDLLENLEGAIEEIKGHICLAQMGHDPLTIYETLEISWE